MFEAVIDGVTDAVLVGVSVDVTVGVIVFVGVEETVGVIVGVRVNTEVGVGVGVLHEIKLPFWNVILRIGFSEVMLVIVAAVTAPIYSNPNGTKTL